MAWFSTFKFNGDCILYTQKQLLIALKAHLLSPLALSLFSTLISDIVDIISLCYLALKGQFKSVTTMETLSITSIVVFKILQFIPLVLCSLPHTCMSYYQAKVCAFIRFYMIIFNYCAFDSSISWLYCLMEKCMQRSTVRNSQHDCFIIWLKGRISLQI